MKLHENYKKENFIFNVVLVVELFSFTLKQQKHLFLNKTLSISLFIKHEKRQRKKTHIIFEFVFNLN